MAKTKNVYKHDCSLQQKNGQDIPESFLSQTLLFTENDDDDGDDGMTMVMLLLNMMVIVVVM